MVTAAVAVPGQTKSPAKAATSSAAKAASKSVPRASNGKPDLTGVWQGGSTRRGTWEEANTGLGVGGTGTDPTAPSAPSSNDRPAGREGAPYQPWAAKKVLESYNMRAIDDPTSRCLPSGIPRIVMLGLFPQQIIQTPQQIVILYEYMNVFRVIPLNVKHPDDLIPAYMGNSVGRWEGDTLVVDVTGFNGHQWLDRAGNFFSDTAHVVERWTPRGRDHMMYEATIEDPAVYTRPWKISFPIYRRLEANAQLLEFNCVPFVEEMLYTPLGLYNPPNRSSR
jgi:hypothetical protein